MTAEEIKKAMEDGTKPLMDKLETVQKENMELKKAQDVQARRFRGSFGPPPTEPSDAGAAQAVQDVLLSKAVNDRDREIQLVNDELVVLTKVFAKREGFPCDWRRFNAARRFERLCAESGELKKAMTTDNTGYGAEWVPTIFSRDLIELLEIARKVVGVFPSMNMTSNPMKISSIVSRPTFKLGTQGSAATESDSGTSNITLDAKLLTSYTRVSDQLDENSIVASVPNIKASLAKGAENTKEEIVLNGDSTATHMDSDSNTSGDRRKAFKGLRRKAIDLGLANVGVDFAGTISLAKLQLMQAKMGKYAVIPSDCVYIIGVNSKHNIVKNVTEIMKVNEYGPNATILKGEIGNIDGIPVVVSEYMREDLNATAVNDPTSGNNTKAAILLVHKGAFMVGNRVLIKLEAEREAKAVSTDLVCSFEMAFEQQYASGEYIVSVGYDITKV